MNKWRLHWDVEDEIVEGGNERDAKEEAFNLVHYHKIKIKLTITKLNHD